MTGKNEKTDFKTKSAQLLATSAFVKAWLDQQQLGGSNYHLLFKPALP
jgi:hypothetical protein